MATVSTRPLATSLPSIKYVYFDPSAPKRTKSKPKAKSMPNITEHNLREGGSHGCDREWADIDDFPANLSDSNALRFPDAGLPAAVGATGSLGSLHRDGEGDLSTVPPQIPQSQQTGHEWPCQTTDVEEMDLAVDGLFDGSSLEYPLVLDDDAAGASHNIDDIQPSGRPQEYQDDTKPDVDTDSDDRPPWEDDTSTQTDNRPRSPGMSAPGCLGKESPPAGLEDVIDSEMVEGAVIQDDSQPSASGDSKMMKSVRFANRLLVPDTECSTTLERHRIILEMNGDARSNRSINQPTQEASGNTAPKAIIHQPRRSMEKKAKRQGKFPTPENASSSGGRDGDGGDSDSDKHTTCATLPTRKRKRPSHAHIVGRKRHGRKSDTASKQYPERPANSSRRQKPSPFRGRPLDNEHTSALCSQPETAPPTKADEDDEYEVEGILEARVCLRKLQYRVKWLGYEDDPEWYDASNFKNCPYKLRDFHTANPTRPGPPKRLGRWAQCWEKYRDANEHPDGSKPESSHIGAGTS